MGHEERPNEQAGTEAWRAAPPPTPSPAADSHREDPPQPDLGSLPPPTSSPAADPHREAPQQPDLGALPPPAARQPTRPLDTSRPAGPDPTGGGAGTIGQDAAARLHSTTSLVGGLTYGALGRAAVLPFLLTVLVGVLAGVVALVSSPSDASLATFLAAPNWVVGNAIDGGVRNLFSLGGRVGVLPLLPLAGIAWYLSRTGIGRRAMQLRVALIAGAMSGLIWAVGGVILSIVIPDPVESSPRPLVAIGAGLATWVLAGALARYRGVRLGIAVFAVWSVLVALLLTGFTVWLMNQFGASGGELAAAIPGWLLVYLLGGPNVALFLGVWPFGVEPAIGADLLPTLGTGGTDFYSLAGESAWLWLVPLVVLGLVVAWGWISTPPTSRQTLYRKVGATAGGILAVLVVATIIGSPRMVAFGGGDSETLGLRGAPFSLLLPTLVFALFWAGALYLRANQLGVSWAALPDLDGSSAGSSDLLRTVGQKLQAVVSAPPAGYLPEQQPPVQQPAAQQQPPVQQPAAQQPPVQQPAPQQPASPERKRFCTECGAAVTGRFCGECGTPSA